MKRIIPLDIIKGISGKFCGSNSKENFATNKCSSAYFTFHSPFVLRSFSVHPPLILRSISVRAPFGDRRMIEETSENHRRQDGDVSKL